MQRYFRNETESVHNGGSRPNLNRVKKLPLFELYNNIKSKLSNAQQEESKKFYGHLQEWFVQKTKDLDFTKGVLQFDSDLIQDFVQYFEEATEHDQRRDERPERCVYLQISA